MAAHGWGKSPSVEAWLFAEGRRFDFFQAVALLEAWHGACRSVGEGAEPQLEAVRFQSSIDLGFPETDVASVTAAAAAGEPAQMKVNFMGLAGALGPLPPPLAELLVQRAARRDTAMRDFLDIFNHRLVSLVYRVRKRHRLGLGVTSPERDDAACYLFALIGLGLPSLRGRLGVSDRSLLHPAGLLARQARPMLGLEAVLRHHFGVPIEGVPLAGAYHRIEADDRTAIGVSGKNRRLGGEAMLGVRAWDQEVGFELRVGPLSLNDFLRFLPGGDALGPLYEMTRFYVGPTLDVAVRLLLRAEEAPGARLGRGPRALLGFTAWLGKGRAGQRPLEVRMTGAVLTGAAGAKGPGRRAVGAA